MSEGNFEEFMAIVDRTWSPAQKAVLSAETKAMYHFSNIVDRINPYTMEGGDSSPFDDVPEAFPDPPEFSF